MYPIHQHSQNMKNITFTSYQPTLNFQVQTHFIVLHIKCYSEDTILSIVTKSFVIMNQKIFI